MGTLRNTAETWRFGVFEFDARSAELRRAGVPIKLRDQSSRILFYFLEYPGQMVTREELRRHLWPADTFVDFDHSLNTAVMNCGKPRRFRRQAPLHRNHSQEGLSLRRARRTRWRWKRKDSPGSDRKRRSRAGCIRPSPP